MIKLKNFKAFLSDMLAQVNAQIAELEPAIAPIGIAIVSVSEAHAIKRLKDAPGVVLLAKLYDTDTRTDGSNDNYAEINHMLIYVMLKMSASEFSNEQEDDKYAELQQTMSLVKEYIMERKMCDARLDKAFRTEWEYNVFGGYNGLSITFDLKDYSL